jgi:hypothetical protein
MKKLILVCSLLAGLLPSAFGQGYEVVDPVPPHININRVRFGAYFAPNVSWMKPAANKSDDGLYRVTSSGSKVGYTWGLLVDYFFTRNYGIATGFQVNNTGGNVSAERLDKNLAPSTVYRADFEYSLQYLEVPFNLKLKSEELPGAGLKLFGQIGLTAGVNIGKQVTYSVYYTDESSKYTTVTGDKEKLTGSLTVAPVLLSLNVGGGIHRPISERMAAYVGFFFNNAFLPDVTSPNEYDQQLLGYRGTFGDGNIRMNSFALRFGLFF